MVRGYFISINMEKLADPSLVRAFWVFPMLSAIGDTAAWMSYNVLRTPYIWLPVAIYIFFGMRIVREMKKSELSILKYFFYLTGSPAIGILICIVFGIRVFIISGNIQFIILIVAICALILLFNMIFAVKIIRWSIVKVNRENKKNNAINTKHKNEPLKYAGAIAVLFALFVVPLIFSAGIIEEQLLHTIILMIFFFVLSFLVSFFGYMAVLLNKHDLDRKIL